MTCDVWTTDISRAAGGILMVTGDWGGAEGMEADAGLGRGGELRSEERPKSRRNQLPGDEVDASFSFSFFGT